MKSGNARGQITEEVRIDYRAADTMARHERAAEISAREKLASAVSNWRLLESTFEAARKVKGVPSSDNGFPQRAADDAERKILKAFLGGELECLGRRSDDGPWEPLPKDCFRLPVQIRLNHNILEPGSKCSMDEHRYVMKNVATWRGLLVNVAALRAWWLRMAAPVVPRLEVERHSRPPAKRGNREIPDSEIVAEIIADLESGAAKSTRAAITARLARIVGLSDSAKYRRLTGKVGEEQERRAAQRDSES